MAIRNRLTWIILFRIICGMTRTKSLREKLGWSQARLASYLGLAQSAVARLEGGQNETGPVCRLLNLLEQDIAAGRPPGEFRPPALADDGNAAARLEP
jgi:transcriptional regulator with XRE-family HTH domain